MALSKKMLLVLQRVDAEREEFLAGLRDGARRDAKVREAQKRAATAKRKPPKLVRRTRPAANKALVQKRSAP